MGGLRKAIRTGALIGLVFCMLVLTRFILFKKDPRYYKHYFTHEYKHYTVDQGWKQANLKPFVTIRLFSSNRVSSEYSYKNIGGNIIGFIPLGILLPIVFRVLRKWWRLTLLVFLISLSFETFQLFTGVGVFDVDDLILNTFGGIIGYFLFLLGAWMVREERDLAAT